MSSGSVDGVISKSIEKVAGLGDGAASKSSRRAAPSTRAVSGWYRQWTDFRRSITGIVVLIIAAMMVPLIGVMLLAVYTVSDANQTAQRSTLAYTARAIAVGVDAEINTYFALANTLAVSEELLSDDLAKFDTVARRATASYPNAWVVVTNLDGQQLVNTGLTPGVQLGFRSGGGLAAQARAVASGQLEVSDVTFGAARQLWTVTVELAVSRNGSPHRVLTVATTLDGFNALLGRQTLPDGWLAAIIDRQGNLVARAPRRNDIVGTPAAAGFRAKAGQEGIWEWPSLEGDLIVNANAVSLKTGWTVGVAISKDVLAANSRRTLSWAGPLAVVIAAMGLAIATLLTRRISGNLADFRNRAGALLQNGHAEFDSHFPELKQCWDDLSTVVKARLNAETALRESEATFSAMFSISSVGMVQVDPQTGRLLRTNMAMCEMTGYSEQELRALTVFDITHPDDRDRDRDGIRRLVSGELPAFDVEKRYVRKDGGVIWGRATVNVIRDDQGRPLRNTAVIQDITTRRQSEEALREREALLSAATGNAAVGLAMLDRHRLYTFVNPAYVRVFGLTQSADQLIGKGPAEVLSSVYASQISPGLDRAFAGERVNYELTRPQPAPAASGMAHYVVAYDPKWNEISGIDGVIVTIFDITERKRAEETMRASQEQLRVAVAVAKLGQWTLDLRTSELTCSEVCKANYGRGPHDRFTYDDLWATIHPDDCDRVRAAFKRAVEDRTDYDTEYQMIWPDGTLHWVIVRGLAQHAPDGTPLVMSGVTLDITNRKRRSLLWQMHDSRNHRILFMSQTISGVFLALFKLTIPCVILITVVEYAFFFKKGFGSEALTGKEFGTKYPIFFHLRVLLVILGFIFLAVGLVSANIKG